MTNAIVNYGSSDAEFRVDALTQAVQHHGMANHSSHENTVPAGADTVIETATLFEAYLRTGAKPSKNAPHR